MSSAAGAPPPQDAGDIVAPASDRDRRLVVAWCVSAVIVLPMPIWVGDLLDLETGWRVGVAIAIGVVLGRLCPTKSAGRWLEHAKRSRGR